MFILLFHFIHFLSTHGSPTVVIVVVVTVVIIFLSVRFVCAFYSVCVCVCVRAPLCELNIYYEMRKFAIRALRTELGSCDLCSGRTQTEIQIAV